MEKSSIFVVPRSSYDWKGNEAGWITASGWASAGKKLWGEAIVATTDGVFSPEEAMLFPRAKALKQRSVKKGKNLRKWVPEFFITAYKDWKLKMNKPKTWPIEREAILGIRNVMFIWERHDLFAGPGKRLAGRLKVPLVISVEALAVWEAAKWGVHRPIWGWLLEKYGEAASLKSADLISCVSEEVKQKVLSMGVDANKVIVSPNRVDSSVFHPHVDGSSVKDGFQLGNKKVIGWTGSFRKFHSLDTVLVAFKKIAEKYDSIVLMLVGDGLEFENIKRLAHELNIYEKVIFTGRQPFNKIPAFISTFDISIVSARSAEGFHYSPLKLREYLAVGNAVIAPRAGNLPSLFSHGSDLLFYQAGSAEDLSSKIEMLLNDDNLLDELKKNALCNFFKEGTWEHELKIVCKKLKIDF